MVSPGDPARPEEIETLRSGLEIMALRALGDREAASEAAQETLVRALEALREGRLEDRRKLGAFVRGIARHVIADVQRARQKHAPLEIVPSHQAQTDSADPLSALVSEEERLHLRLALAELSPGDREILHLSFFDGMSPSEIAGVLGEPATTIRKRKSRALRRLRSAFFGGAETSEDLPPPTPDPGMTDP